MSNTYYCHGCEARRPVIWTPIITCTRCGCNIIDQIPLVDTDSSDDLEEDFNAELDFFFHQEDGDEDDDDEEEALEERCLYERLSSIYNHPIARNLNSSNESSSTQMFGWEEDIISYDIPSEQRSLEQEHIETESVNTITSAFLLPFARFNRILDTMYSYRSDEESEDGDDGIYHRRSFLDNLADILSDYTSDIDINNRNTSPNRTVESIVSTLRKECLKPTDADVNEECIICQEDFGTTLEIYYLPCKHKYHGLCISRWFSVNTSCPICRHPVDNIPDEPQESPPIYSDMMDQINREIDLLFATADPFDDEEDDEDEEEEEEEHLNHDSGASRNDLHHHISSFDDIILDQFMGIYDRPTSNYPPVGLSTTSTMNDIMDWAYQTSSMEEVD